MPRGVGVTRARVIEVAAAIADERGFEALSIGEIAARLGVRPPSLYKHVAGLPEIQAELALLGYAALAESLAAGIGLDPAERARVGARTARRFAKEHPGLYAAATRSHVRGPEMLRAAGDVLMGALVEASAFGRADPIDASRALRALVHGFVGLERDGGFADDDVEASFEVALNALIAGLRAGP